VFEVSKGIQSILKACVTFEPQEPVLVIVDNEGGPKWIGELFMNAITSMGAEVVLTAITPSEFDGQEPPASVAAAMKCANAIFRVSDRNSMVHTTARKEATAAGARYFTVFQVPVDALKKGVSRADMSVITKRTESLARRLTKANFARVTTALGTDITLGLRGRQGLALSPMSPVVSGLPFYAEAAIAPVEGTAEGVIVADLAVVGWGYLLREPLRYTVEAGKVVSISGRIEDAKKLRKITAVEENASNIAELGIGTSHIVPLPIHGIRNDAARVGTAHIAMGRNDDIGGTTWSNIHLDSLMDRATVELDGDCVLRDGKLLI